MMLEVSFHIFLILLIKRANLLIYDCFDIFGFFYWGGGGLQVLARY